jgi:hypothetical protein
MSFSPFEMVGDPDAETCEDGVCAVPAGPRPEDTDRPKQDDLADAGPGLLVPVQR